MSDRMLILGGPVHPVRHSREVASFGVAPDAGPEMHRTLVSASGQTDMSAQWLRVEHRTLAASGQGGPDASDRRKPDLDPYCKRPDAAGSGSGQFCWSVRSVISHCDLAAQV